MRLRATLTALTLLPLAAFSVATDHADECDVLAGGETSVTTDDVLACESVMYLGGCEDAVGGKLHEQFVGGDVPLVADEPTTSFTAGGGCGWVDEPLFNGVYQSTPYSFDVSGFFESVNPKTMTVELHDISASTMRDTGETTVDVRLTIDGHSPFGFEETTNVSGDPFQSPVPASITLEAVPSSTGVSDALIFTVIGLDENLPADFFKPGTGTFHQVALTFDFGLDGYHAMVWGASEVPASVKFNAGIEGTPVYVN